MKHAWLAAAFLAVGLSSAEAQTRVLFGRVDDSTFSEPVKAGLIRVLGTPIQAQVKVDGTFIIYVPVREVTLAFEARGFHPREVRVGTHDETVIIPVRRDIFQLGEIVVSGHATGVERRNLANAVGSVDGEDLARVPSRSFDDALRGRVNGATISSNSGAPGGGMRLRLRGISTLLGNAEPLYIVDGIMVSNASIPSGTNAVTRGQAGVIASSQEDAVNRIADLNPNDIESIEILKGASASAMYGSKASNGVVIITTKRGRFLNGR